MAAFEYTALDQDGRTRKGILEGDSLRHVRQLLRDIGLVPMDVSEASSVQKKAKQSTFRGLFQKLRPMEMVVFTRQLSTLVGAGLPLEEALSAVAQQTKRKKARSIFMSVRSRVIQGHTLTASLAEHPVTFDELYQSTVGAGEQSGQLDNVLESLADFLEKQNESRRNIESALYYPVLLLVVAVLIVGALMTNVVPTIKGVFEQSGQELPMITTILIALSEFLQNWVWVLLFGFIGLIIITRYSFSFKPMKFAWHTFKLRLPFIGWFSRSLNASRYANTLAILTSSGVPLVDGMRISSKVVNNVFIRKQVEMAVDLVSEGTSLNKALTDTRQFPPIFVHMIASGEMSGALDKMLYKSAEYQQKELERIIDTMVELFRPIMLLVMAGMVLFIMMAILLPILNMNQFAV